MTDTRLIVAPRLYEHEKPDHRALCFAENRIKTIEADIEQLRLEKQMWQRIVKLVEREVCKRCAGSGEVGYYPDGMQDGMKFKSCPDCKGKGL
jgi:hypothetical protein